ncbi:MAG: ATP-dependent helicase [bacterium]|nr:ATP-dependent helicase [bacterium]MDZ4285192.1 ATP-dependent helicase [Patescibacteria group bacterium]
MLLSDELDADQDTAVSALDGPVVIVAGPGSGKTRVLVERVSRLICERGVPPEQILAITFTNKAVDEIRERIRAAVAPTTLTHQAPIHSPRLSSGFDGQALATFRSPVVATFHALAHTMLREYGELVGVPPNFRVGEKPRGKRAGTNDTALDFDALLSRALELLRTHEDVLAHYRSRFNFILADEYQDANALQSTLLDLLAAGHRNLCVIGDPNQSIYSFRAADPRHFSSFTERYPDARVLRLIRNYRSTPSILAVAGSCIGSCATSDVAQQEQKSTRPHIIHAASDRAEALWIVRTIEREIGGADLLRAGAGNFSFGDFAVIYRLHALAREFESALNHVGIPFRTIGGVGFFEQPEVRNVLEKLETLDLPDHDADYHANAEIPIAANDLKFSTLSQAVNAIATQSNAKQHDRRVTPRRNTLSDRILELVGIATQFDHLELAEARRALLARATLARPEDTLVSGEAVMLLSAHAAKGLEFPVVFVAGVEEGLFPYLRPDEVRNDERIAEERRLLYVAMTRAKERLYLSQAAKRTLFGKTYFPAPSRFLASLPENLCERIFLRPPQKRTTTPQARLF